MQEDARASYGDVRPPHQRAEPAEAATEGCPQDDDGEGRRRHGLRRGVRLGGDGDAVRRGAEALQDGSPAVPAGLSPGVNDRRKDKDKHTHTNPRERASGRGSSRVTHSSSGSISLPSSSTSTSTSTSHSGKSDSGASRSNFQPCSSEPLASTPSLWGSSPLFTRQASRAATMASFFSLWPMKTISCLRSWTSSPAMSFMIIS
mmetsp:Transcript_9219/g.31872  ORF Transcript_9219/g.31872 Transcript_9219/m.31872 type:complete len:203 (-) Transcript_9219:179-787(-)